MGAPRSTEPRSEVFTVGYQGRSLEELLALVRRHRIEQVLDVRDNPASLKAGFAEEDLRQALGAVGVGYESLPGLGCDREARHTLWGGGDRGPFLESYRRRLRERPEALADLAARAGTTTTLILCLERDATACHRSVLAEHLRGLGFLTRDL